MDGSEFSIAAFDYLDVALDLVDTHPDDAALTTRFAQIGMGTPDRFDSNELAPALAAALGEGQRHGLDEMRGLVASMADDPLGSAKVFGTRAFLEETARSLGHPNLYLPRSTAAMIGLYGNSGEEAIYPTYLADADGDPLDASEHEYVMTFPAGELPPARAFWSLTMYDGQTQLFIENPLDRYLLSSTMSEQFVRAEDGSIVFSIQKDSPGGEQEANWLPAPDGPFYLVLRLYLPEPRVLDGEWTPSALTKVQ